MHWSHQTPYSMQWIDRREFYLTQTRSEYYNRFISFFYLCMWFIFIVCWFFIWCFQSKWNLIHFSTLNGKLCCSYDVLSMQARRKTNRTTERLLKMLSWKMSLREKKSARYKWTWHEHEITTKINHKSLANAFFRMSSEVQQAIYYIGHCCQNCLEKRENERVRDEQWKLDK